MIQYKNNIEALKIYTDYSNTDINKDELLKIIDTLIIKDTTTRENNIYDIINNLNIILNNNIFKRSLREAKNNWLGISIEEVIDNVINYFKSMETVGI